MNDTTRLVVASYVTFSQPTRTLLELSLSLAREKNAMISPAHVVAPFVHNSASRGITSSNTHDCEFTIVNELSQEIVKKSHD